MNELQLYDIYEHWHVPFWQTLWFRAGIIAGVLLTLCFFLVLLFRKYYKKSALSSTQCALRDLQLLQDKKIITREEAHAAYFSLTSTLKTFFQHHYNRPFESMSDYEMIANLRIYGMPVDQLILLEHIVNASLSVKYARENALHEDVMQAVSNSITIVKQLASEENK